MLWLDFDKEEILVRPQTDHLGPLRFGFAPWLPPGRTIAAAVVKSFKEGTETSDYLIDPATGLYDTTNVDVYLQWPIDGNGKAYPGRHRLVFLLTFDDGATDEAWVYDVVAKSR